MEKAVVLLSGGLDSTVCMAVAKSKGMEVFPISFNYHQRHNIELEGAKKVAKFYGVRKHLIIETNMEDIDAIAVTRGPGLAGSLVVGMNAAKGLAFSTGLPWRSAALTVTKAISYPSDRIASSSDVSTR